MGNIVLPDDLWFEAKDNPLVFFENFCFTKDEAAAGIGGEIYKPLPMQYPHAREVVKCLFDLPPYDDPQWKSHVQAFWKGRQEFVTWIMVCACVYMMMFRPGCRIGTTSTKEKKAKEHTERFDDVLVHMPGIEEGEGGVRTIQSPFGIYRFELKESKGLVTCIAPDGTESHIHALAATPRESRQYTFTWIWIDEAGSIQNIHRFYKAARSTVNKPGCKLILTDTAPEEDKEKFFVRLCEGALEVA